MRSNNPMSNDEIQRYAPSAFAGQPYSKQSDRYTFVPTSDVIDGMRSAGFQPVMAGQSRSRIEGKAMFTKHMIRFRSQDQTLTAVGDSVLETVLVNSHDGTSAYRLSMGVFRLVCSNGLVVADALVQSVAIRHVGNITERVIESTREMLTNAPTVADAINRWRQIQLSQAEQLFLAESAHALRFEDNNNLAVAIPAQKLLAPRRYNDNGTDLWSTFNRVQENTVRGGVRGFDAQRGTRVRSREVKGIDQSTTLNRQLWTLAEKMAELKGQQ